MAYMECLGVNNGWIFSAVSRRQLAGRDIRARSGEFGEGAVVRVLIVSENYEKNQLKRWVVVGPNLLLMIYMYDICQCVYMYTPGKTT